MKTWVVRETDMTSHGSSLALRVFGAAEIMYLWDGILRSALAAVVQAFKLVHFVAWWTIFCHEPSLWRRNRRTSQIFWYCKIIIKKIKIKIISLDVFLACYLCRSRIRNSRFLLQHAGKHADDGFSVKYNCKIISGSKVYNKILPKILPT